MFEVFGEGPPEDWEPIPDHVFEEIGDWDDDDPADRIRPVAVGPSHWVAEALARPLSTETLPLVLAVDFAEIDDEHRSLALQRLEEFEAHLASVRARLVAAIAGPAPTKDARRDDFAANEIAVATKCSVYSADAKISIARHLATQFTATAAALAAGTISYAQAEHMIASIHHLDPVLREEIEAMQLKISHRQNLTNFKRCTRNWLEKKDPSFTKRAREARREVSVTHDAVGDGVGELNIRGPLELTTALSIVLNAIAAKTRSELGGTADARKLAALRDLTDSYLASSNAARHHGRLPTVNITIDLATLLNLRAGIAEIPGVGSIPTETAQLLLADGAPWRRLVTDPLSGALIDHGTDAYQVPPWLADQLCATNITSASPHSNVDSRGCDMEHNQPHDRGGTTDPVNVTPVDRRWHRAKTHGGWTYRKNPDSKVVTWTSPTGLTCQIDPYDYRYEPPLETVAA